MSLNLRRHLLLRWAAVVAWMGLIFGLSAQSKLPDPAPGIPGLAEISGHLFVYGALALLLWRAMQGSAVRYPATWSLALAVLYGATDEFHQSFVPGRTMSVTDLMVDLMGAVLALAIATVITARRRAPSLQKDVFSDLSGL